MEKNIEEIRNKNEKELLRTSNKLSKVLFDIYYRKNHNQQVIIQAKDDKTHYGLFVALNLIFL